MQEYIILYNSILRLFGKINARCVAWAADNDRGFHLREKTRGVQRASRREAR